MPFSPEKTPSTIVQCPFRRKKCRRQLLGALFAGKNAVDNCWVPFSPEKMPSTIVGCCFRRKKCRRQLLGAVFAGKNAVDNCWVLFSLEKSPSPYLGGIFFDEIAISINWASFFAGKIALSQSEGGFRRKNRRSLFVDEGFAGKTGVHYLWTRVSPEKPALKI